MDSKEAYKMKQEMGDKVQFIDVRDPIEIMFTGFTNVADINIPFKVANKDAWHSKKPVFLWSKIGGDSKGLAKDTPIILICRSGGTKCASSAKQLWGKGYTNVYVVTDGFEGRKIKEGDQKNRRLVNGWKNSGLPWSYKLNKEKMYFKN